MSNNTDALDAFRAAAAGVLSIDERLGMSSTRVTVRRVVYDKPLDDRSAAVVSSTDVVLSPVPMVRQVRRGRADAQVGWPGAAHFADGTADPTTLRYDIGPIAHLSTSGGYDPNDLATASDTTRVTVLLAGDDFGADPVEHVIVRMNADGPVTWTMTVERARSVP